MTAKSYAQASSAFSREAAIYRAKGDAQAARVEELRAARYRSELELFQRLPSVVSGIRARIEPEAGCYVGAFIDRDDRLKNHQFGSQIFGDIGQFNALTEKQHGSFFSYLRYGNPFPRDWANYVKQNRAICHIAWEPHQIELVADDAYLNRFVNELRTYDHPVILRFAGEMNGDWTAYHRDPARYRRAFRLIHEKTRSCPRVATLWCPNSVPSDNFAAYYPGDDGCDWVGVNLYSVMFVDNEPKRPGDWIHPIDLVEPIYRAYAGRKPIAIGEYAASHRAACVPKDNIAFAQLKLAQLYQAIPTRFPRLKMVNWFNCNNILKARAGRQLNNYQLTDSSRLLETYEEHVNNGYFVGLHERASWRAQAMGERIDIASSEELKVEVFARSYLPDPLVLLELDGKLVMQAQLPKRQACNLGRLSSGRHRLRAILVDCENRLILQKSVQIRVR